MITIIMPLYEYNNLVVYACLHINKQPQQSHKEQLIHKSLQVNANACVHIPTCTRNLHTFWQIHENIMIALDIIVM